jgi:2-oxoglutarate ferredoxin oxidoreductase subunit alpha
MMEKRMKKLEAVDTEIPVEEKVSLFGDENSKNLIVSWGSPKGAIIESLKKLLIEGFSLRFMQIRMLHPFPREHVFQILKNAQRIINVENNYLGQLGSLIREEAGTTVNYHILKYTGRPMATTEVYVALKNILSDQAPERQVLTYGS